MFGQVPEGMSAYQADWFTDEQGQGDFDDPHSDAENDFENNSDNNMNEEAGDKGLGGEADLDGKMDTNGLLRSTPAEVRLAEKQKQREQERLRMLNDEKSFPDEVDTPEDMAARVRFARYRALQSFKSSPWHPRENLPQDYSAIFQLENFNLVQKRWFMFWILFVAVLIIILLNFSPFSPIILLRYVHVFKKIYDFLFVFLLLFIIVILISN